jgi:hypothetical protein
MEPRAIRVNGRQSVCGRKRSGKRAASLQTRLKLASKAAQNVVNGVEKSFKQSSKNHQTYEPEAFL